MSETIIPRYSVVIPVFNERDNLRPLVDEVSAGMKALGEEFEIIFTDDGSTDGSRDILRGLCAEHKPVRAQYFDRNYGQTSGFDAGFKAARGEIVITMDADLQVKARDVLPLIRKLDEGYDAVVGYRTVRADSMKKRISSLIANTIRNVMSGENWRDVGCPLKVVRREALEKLKLFDGMHRFFPTLLAMEGCSVAQMPVPHYPRIRGASKYGIGNRLARSFHDLLGVKWMKSRMLRYRFEKTEEPSA